MMNLCNHLNSFTLVTGCGQKPCLSRVWSNPVLDSLSIREACAAVAGGDPSLMDLMFTKLILLCRTVAILVTERLQTLSNGRVKL